MHVVVLFVFLSQIENPYDVLDLGRIVVVDVQRLTITVSASYALMLDNNSPDSPSQVQLEHSVVHGMAIILSVSSSVQIDESSFFALDVNVLSSVPIFSTFSSIIFLFLVMERKSPDLEDFEMFSSISFSGGSAYVKLLTDFLY